MARAAALAAALALAAGAAGAAIAPGQVALVEPAAGTTLVAGETAWLEWVATPPLAAGIEEWEAFLSVDGGRYFAVRLTPHLDLGRRRFAFTVPALPSDEVRLLLRFGDERQEVGVDVPGSYRIVAGRVPASLPLRPTALARGEAARPGERGVVVWVAGSRDGQGLRARQAPPPPDAAPAALFAGGPSEVGVAAPEPPVPPPAPAARHQPRAVPSAGASAAVAPSLADRRLLTGRQNE